MKEKIEDRKTKYSKYDLDIEIFITAGNPTDKILDYAIEKKVDLVVIGITGLSWISKFFKGLGSVSRNVSEKDSCPVFEKDSCPVLIVR